MTLCWIPGFLTEPELGVVLFYLSIPLDRNFISTVYQLLLSSLQNKHDTWPHESYVLVKEKDDKEKNNKLIIFTTG